jgi:spore maturation protein CgeB
MHPAAGCCFIGNKDRARDIWLKGLVASSVRPIIYGNYFLRDALFWQHPGLFRPAVSNAKMGDVYARYRVALNLHAAVVRHGTNMRSFECAAYGIPQVVDYRDGLARHFTLGTEILVSRTPVEMAQQVNALLAQPEAATQMAQRARQRALTEHTYYHRIQTMLNDIVPISNISTVT